jgi:hypothetical protein
MKKYLSIAKEIAMAGSLLMLTARVACITGVLAATGYWCAFN